MKKLLMVICSILILAVPAAADERSDFGVLLNQERAKAGRSQLKQSDALNKAAQLHAEDMVNQDYFSHKGKNGSSAKKRIKKQWRKTCMWAENIAYGPGSASGVMKMWMKSSGHKKNNLSKLPTHFGVGFDGRKNIWVLVFAKGC